MSRVEVVQMRAMTRPRVQPRHGWLKLGLRQRHWRRRVPETERPRHWKDPLCE